DRFDLTYVAADGERRRPVMVHRVILGAIERFIGILIEHYAGNFPLWLSPVQGILLTVTDSQIPYAQGVYSALREAGIRVQHDFRNEKLGFKIREAQLQRTPYMFVIGDKEVATETVTPRFRDGSNLPAMKLAELIEFIEQEVKRFK
ncbi:MAG: threonine--tRNA ligase, partial [Deltaproteobacteria bacterium]|nr:threonine--tRNA ligase [Deltaproteobacteria bacterium]